MRPAHAKSLPQVEPTFLGSTGSTQNMGVYKTFFAMCKSIDSPHSLALWLCFKYDHEAFVDLQLDPRSYGDNRIASVNRHACPDYFAYDLLCQEYLSKYKGLNLKRDRSVEAYRTFQSTENRMKQVNSSLSKLHRTHGSARLEAIISIARRKISDVLGSRKSAKFDFGWGPGTTFTVKGDVAWDKKILEKRISVTAAALPIAQTVVGADLHWCQARGIPAEAPCTLLSTEFKVVPGNRITNVPKNAKTDRTIAIEPTANVFLQKGIGQWIRRRLRKVARIDLDSQSLNQRYAGRLDYATIDLKAASDSISREIVSLLLPEEWSYLLDCVRSPNYLLQGSWTRYEKWSSMGNGYTFELETLLFWALSMATMLIDSEGAHAIVYGDDILVPVKFAERCIRTLNDFGFETNAKKTHYASLYRESCGAHFFDRVLVTPVYQKEVPIHAEEIYHMANRLRHVATRLGGYHYSDSRIFSAWHTVIRSIRSLPHYAPLAFHQNDDMQADYENVSLQGGFHLSIEDCELLGRPIVIYGTKLKLLQFVPQKRRYDQAAGLCYTLQSGNPLDSEHLTLRGRGRVAERRKRCLASFRSNTWL